MVEQWMKKYETWRILNPYFPETSSFCCCTRLFSQKFLLLVDASDYNHIKKARRDDQGNCKINVSRHVTHVTWIYFIDFWIWKCILSLLYLGFIIKRFWQYLGILVKHWIIVLQWMKYTNTKLYFRHFQIFDLSKCKSFLFHHDFNNLYNFDILKGLFVVRIDIYVISFVLKNKQSAVLFRMTGRFVTSIQNQ